MVASPDETGRALLREAAAALAQAAETQFDNDAMWDHYGKGYGSSWVNPSYARCLNDERARWASLVARLTLGPERDASAALRSAADAVSAATELPEGEQAIGRLRIDLARLTGLLESRS